MKRSLPWSGCSLLFLVSAGCATSEVDLGVGRLTFEQRCALPAVVKCFGFDAPAQADPFIFPPYGMAVKRAGVVTDIKASGAGSLRFEIPSNTGSDSSGSFWQNFSDDLSVQFGEGEEFYVQWRQRFSREFLETFYEGGGGWKQAIIGEGDRPGKTVYSWAPVNVRPSASTASRHASQVSTSSSCPRARSSRARAIAGKACPGSPNAATTNLIATDPRRAPHSLRWTRGDSHRNRARPRARPR